MGLTTSQPPVIASKVYKNALTTSEVFMLFKFYSLYMFFIP